MSCFRLVRRVAAALALACLLSPAALAQSTPVYQSGLTARSGDLPKITRNGQITDTAAAGLLGDGSGLGVNPFAITDYGALGVCLNSASTGGNYNALCLGHDGAGNGIITLDSFGLALAALNFRVNGTTVSVPGPGASGHVAVYGANNQVSDGGSGANAASGLATGLGLAGSGQPLALYSAPSTGPYIELKEGFDGGGNGVVSLDGQNGASAPSTFTISTTGPVLQFRTSAGTFPVGNVNGTNLDLSNATLPAARGNLQPRRTVASGSSDSATTADYAVYWNSAATAAKAEAIPGCTNTIDKMTMEIGDEAQSAQSYPITITPSSGTIYGASSLTLNANGDAVSLQCDGSQTNWMVQ